MFYMFYLTNRDCLAKLGILPLNSSAFFLHISVFFPNIAKPSCRKTARFVFQNATDSARTGQKYATWT